MEKSIIYFLYLTAILHLYKPITIAISLYRDVEMSGYLNKRGTLKKEWKRFWFVLARPYLYYYSNKELENEKIIYLTNSAVSAVDDPEVILISIYLSIYPYIYHKLIYFLLSTILF